MHDDMDQKSLVVEVQMCHTEDSVECTTCLDRQRKAVAVKADALLVLLEYFFCTADMKASLQMKKVPL